MVRGARCQDPFAGAESIQLVKYVAESTQGFTWTLAGLKAFLEHGIKLNLVADKNPDAHKDGWQQA